MRVLMLVAGPVAGDARVLREAASLARAGHAVHVVGRGVPAGFVPPPGVTVSSAGERPVPPGAARAADRTTRTPAGATAGRTAATGRTAGPARGRRPLWWRAARWLLLPTWRSWAFSRWARAARADARTRVFDVVHAHDFTALPAGARLAHERGVPLVYDSHELWFGRPVVGRPTPFADRLGRRREQRLGARAAAVITVGDGVAEALEDRYGWTDVRVVRNSFRVTPAAGAPPKARRLVYAGRLAEDRELEVIAAAAPSLPLPVDLIGPADATWLRSFDPGTARVLDPVDPDEVTRLLRRCGVALVTHSDRWPNHRLALPNKLFQAVAAGVPVVATDVGELATAVRSYGLGALYRPGDARSLAVAVDDVLARFGEYAANVSAAARSLSWDADERVLLDVYTGLGPPSPLLPAAGPTGPAGPAPVPTGGVR